MAQGRGRLAPSKGVPSHTRSDQEAIAKYSCFFCNVMRSKMSRRRLSGQQADITPTSSKYPLYDSVCEVNKPCGRAELQIVYSLGRPDAEFDDIECVLTGRRDEDQIKRDEWLIEGFPRYDKVHTVGHPRYHIRSTVYPHNASMRDIYSNGLLNMFELTRPGGCFANLQILYTNETTVDAFAENIQASKKWLVEEFPGAHICALTTQDVVRESNGPLFKKIVTDLLVARSRGQYSHCETIFVDHFEGQFMQQICLAASEAMSFARYEHPMKKFLGSVKGLVRHGSTYHVNRNINKAADLSNRRFRDYFQTLSKSAAMMNISLIQLRGKHDWQQKGGGAILLNKKGWVGRVVVVPEKSGSGSGSFVVANADHWSVKPRDSTEKELNAVMDLLCNLIEEAHVPRSDSRVIDLASLDGQGSRVVVLPDTRKILTVSLSGIDLNKSGRPTFNNIANDNQRKSERESTIRQTVAQIHSGFEEATAGISIFIKRHGEGQSIRHRSFIGLHEDHRVRPGRRLQKSDSLASQQVSQSHTYHNHGNIVSEGKLRGKVTPLAVDVGDRPCKRLRDVGDWTPEVKMPAIVQNPLRPITPWKMTQQIGEGSFGIVSEAVDADGMWFAVKQVSLTETDKTAQEKICRLIQEIDFFSWLKHKNIVQYLGTEKDHDKLYVFLELATKRSLEAVYKATDLEPSHIRAYTRQVLEGLEYLHANGVVHMDVKCANILVESSGICKLADFGLAEEIGGLCETNAIPGTPHWMAPEVIRSEIGPRLPADIWSLGCTVIEMTTRSPPFGSKMPGEIMLPVSRGTLAPTIPNALPKLAKDFVQRCLIFDPMKRPTASELLQHPFIQQNVDSQFDI